MCVIPPPHGILYVNIYDTQTCEYNIRKTTSITILSER